MTQAVIFGMGRGERRLDGDYSLPVGMNPIFGGQPNLQRLLNALLARKIDDCLYVGGYHIEKVVEAFPDMRVSFFRSWQHKGEVAALTELHFTSGKDILLLSGETLFLPSAIDALLSETSKHSSSSETLVGVIAKESAMHLGAMYIPASNIKWINTVAEELATRDPKANLSCLASALPDIQYINIDEHAALLTNRAAVRRLVFQGKARTLDQLKGLVRGARIPEQLTFKLEEWKCDEQAILSKIQKYFPSGLIVARSSTVNEDLVSSSGAGKFHSELDIDANDLAGIRRGIQSVVNSYSKNDRQADMRDEILVQRQISNLGLSGVLLTRDTATGAPYYVLNFESESGRSDIVTSGGRGKLRTIFHSSLAAVEVRDPELKHLITLANELIELTYNDALDIEFGCDNEGQLYLFQVRPISSMVSWSNFSDQDLGGLQTSAANHFRAHSSGHPKLLGAKTIFANMSDWNPAEMIGTQPNPLALSLYQTLVGDWVWAKGRARIGYSEIGPQPLIHSFGGRPYVDVRASLNSLLPAGLDDEIATRWVDDCIERLRESPDLQDKIEFDITVTCLAFDWKAKASKMREAALSETQISKFQRRLASLTEKIVSSEMRPVETELKIIDQLDSMRKKYSMMTISNEAEAARKIHFLVDSCALMGALPFASLARYGFIAISLLRSLREEGVFSPEDQERVLRGIPTVASQFTKDLVSYSEGKKEISELIHTYGHLRPHSYDITSPSYAEEPEILISVSPKPVGESSNWSDIEDLFSIHDKEITRRIDDLGMKFSTADLATFIKTSIAGREKAKFEFMKTVDELLKTIMEFGKFLGFSRDDMAYIPIQEILEYSRNSASGASSGRLNRGVAYRKKRQELTRALRLPDVLIDEKDFYSFEQYAGKPNFVTRAKVIAPIVLIESFSTETNLNGKIVAIRAADPGFDWIFGHPIVGLVTEYGGLASHMAIRAAEFGLPAAIGCGGQIFNKIVKAERLELDCANERIIPI